MVRNNLPPPLCKLKVQPAGGKCWVWCGVEMKCGVESVVWKVEMKCGVESGVWKVEMKCGVESVVRKVEMKCGVESVV